MFLQQGMLHWATAGFRLREQRVQAVAQEAATRAQRVWRKVAQIASHWRYVALRGRRPNRSSSSSVRYEVSPTLRTLGVSGIDMAPAARISRPAPRKPVDLLVNDVNVHGVAKYDVQYTFDKSLAAIQTFVRPTDAMSSLQEPAYAVFDQETLLRDSTKVEETSSIFVGPADEATPSTRGSKPTVSPVQHLEMALREMEGRLHYWQQKKLEWKMHKHQMQAVRSHLNGLRANDASAETVDVLERALVAMEATHADHQAAFQVSKKEMTAYTDQIQRLRRHAAN
ncbi:hypothetical protein SPRG_04630 [Saprolegnia parasitica CBS 223.65]|uniref:Uncharacterized protein n=1 Tax=Saprolegnia parasitica (strain CBS 223.65) TaxID=695850 RepID=A0A067CJ41_SAPPC|nr:hypothetical protein SPRG_04630 [Saprolegnia parasitica CBS 223.65]KDO30729.1 hypothetical protein SPRG_04630 [Saprolegnia parasitica CBS 223.65]|eukprot:XP_012198429.1 hypothetical protein SPRG_04630 [Saprolegnia parasitica CBS 223.65]